MTIKSITPQPPANFTPEMGSYKTLQPFRYWCQKILPLVYDDSLSYYELLCKVVDYLNKTMEDVETLHGDITNLHTAYEELQSYVNNYFSTLDVQEEINKKLDEMSNDGSLSAIILPLVSQNIAPHVVDSLSEMTNKNYMYVLSTTGDIYFWDGSKFKKSSLKYPENIYEMVKYYDTLPDNTDLNDISVLSKNSFYGLVGSYNYTNLPDAFSDNHYGVLILNLMSSATEPNYQICFGTRNKYYSKIAMRQYADLKWQPWVVNEDFYSVSYNKSILSNNADLNDMNDVKLNGYYGLSYGYTYKNLPKIFNNNGTGVVLCCLKGSDTQGHYQWAFGTRAHNAFKIAVRAYYNGSWGEWIEHDLNKINKNKLLKPCEYVSDEKVNNSGINIRVMAYNVANWNNDTTKYINSANLHNLKNLLCDVNADIMCFNEYREYLDEKNTQNAKKTLLNPMWSNCAGIGYTVISAKTSFASEGTWTLTSSRLVRFCKFNGYGADGLLVVCPHLSPNFNDEDTRLTELNELLSKIKTIKHTYLIIAGDFNGSSDIDYNNLINFCKSNELRCGNMGYNGILATCYSGGKWYACDNVITSKNIIINRFTSHTDKFGELYSDHVPVTADLTLIQ